MTDTATGPEIKVRVSIPNGPGEIGDGGPAGESMWAELVNDNGYGGLARIKNTPFFAFGYALGDLVEFTYDSDSVREITALKESSGALTFRLLIANPDEESKALMTVSDVFRGWFGQDKTSGEGFGGAMLAVSVSGAKRVEVTRFLDAMQKRGLINAWESGN